MGEGTKLRRSIYSTLAFVALIWGVKIVEFTFDYNFGQFGILPRTLSGSVGIFTAPLIHGDVYHLISNTLPLTILGVGLFYFYDKIALNVVLLIYLMTGFWVWVAAREAYHIGASGLVYGMLTFLLFSGFIRRDSSTLAISFVVLFLYGGTFFAGIVPEDSSISWESHLMGAIAGIFCAFYFKNFKTAAQIASSTRESTDEVPATDNYIYFYKPQNKEEENTPAPEDREKGSEKYTITYPLSKEEE